MENKLAAAERELAGLRARGTVGGNGSPAGGIRPEGLIWLFGVARSGSTWLGKMMGEIDGQALWDEPLVGDVFGYAYYTRAWDWMRNREEFALGDPHKDVWLKSIRNFVLDGANARHPETVDGGYLVIKEPNGSIGAPLLIEALPESRVVLLMRDPRDVVASLLAANKKGSWVRDIAPGRVDSRADVDPDAFVKKRAQLYMVSMLRAKEAYESHKGPKTTVRYEDLRYNTFEELKGIHFNLGIAVEDESLRRVVEKHDWTNVPAELKGPDKPRRKAQPGSYEDDLTPGQVEVVEEITAPILDQFYA
jgi:hypothetical protein